MCRHEHERPIPDSKSPVRRRGFAPPCAWNVLKAACFSGNTVGAYGIRPTERHPMDGECLSTTNGRILALLRRDVWRAYSIRPYTGTCKRAAVSTSHLMASPKGSLFLG